MQIPEQPDVNRITWKSIGAEVLKQLNLERGLGFTIKQLVVAPEKAIREYLFENRRRMIKPFPFLLLTVGLATIASLRFLPMGEDLIAEMEKDTDFTKLPERLKPLVTWMVLATKKYFNVIYMSSLPGTTLASFWVFRKYQLTIPEHLVINVYLFCIQTVIYLIFIPFAVPIPWLAFVQAFLIVLYMFYAYIRIFHEPIGRGIWRSLLVQIFAQIFYGIILFIIGGLALLFLIPPT